MPITDDVAHARAAARNAVNDRLGPPTTRVHDNAWRRFVRRYGWRAYALPVLIVITVAALMQGTGSGAGAGTTAAPRPTANTPVIPPPAKTNTVIKQDVGAGSKVSATVLAAAALPPGPAYDTTGTGTFHVLPGTTKQVGTGRLYRYSIDVENGLTGVDLTQFESIVDSTLADPRSWSGHGVALERVDSGPIDFHVSMTSSMTVRALCGYSIPVETSCYVSAGSVSGLDVNRVVINDARWTRGAVAYAGDLAQYRQYMINHEDGHALGHNHEHQCLPGGLAPTMMQQTFGLRSTATGKFCQANPWPYPPGVTGAPGAEQLDTAANNEFGRGD